MENKRNRNLLIGGGILLALLLLSNRANAAPAIPKPADIPGGKWINVGGSWRWVVDSADGGGSGGGVLPGSGSGGQAPAPLPGSGGNGQVTSPWCEGCSPSGSGSGQNGSGGAILPSPMFPPDGPVIAPPTPIWAFPGDEPAVSLPPVLPPPQVPTYTPPPPPVYVAPPPPPPVWWTGPQPLPTYVAPPEPVYVTQGTGPYTYDSATGQIQSFAPAGYEWVASNEGGSATDGYYRPIVDDNPYGFGSGN